jgi:soluble lytic murein transglycosylase-like protein
VTRERLAFSAAVLALTLPALILGYGRVRADEPSRISRVPASAFRPVATRRPIASGAPSPSAAPSVTAASLPATAVEIVETRPLVGPSPAAAPRPIPSLPGFGPIVVPVATPKPPPLPPTGGATPSVADAKAYARSRIGSTQFTCLDALWTRESKWNPYATNRSSGAYGIPQALPGDKMATFGADWRTNPVTQVKWGLSYIANRYGSACAAWSHSQQYGWY